MALFRGKVWQWIAFLLCLLDSVALLINTNPSDDGAWFWYGYMLREGKRVYADLHLPLQPLYPLMNEWSQRLFGPSLNTFKMMALVQIVLFLYGLMLLLEFAPGWKDRQKALMLAAAYLITPLGDHFRFDDYHLITCLACVWPAWLLLKMRDEPRDSRLFLYGAISGVLCGLSLMNRINDGGAAVVALLMAVPFMAPRRKFTVWLTCAAASAATLAVIVLMTGDTFHTWAWDSIIHAATIKGGAGKVSAAPFALPLNILKKIVFRKNVVLLGVFAYALPLALLIFRRGVDGTAKPVPTWKKVVVLAALAASLIFIAKPTMHLESADGVALIGVIAMIGLMVVVLWRTMMHLLGRPGTWSPAETLLLFPFGMLLAKASSSNNSLPDWFPPVALLFVLLPIIFPVFFRRFVWQGFLVVMAVAAIPSAAALKAEKPYDWLHYREDRIFFDRAWYRHPVLGPIYMQREQLAIMRNACDLIQKDGAPDGLLSLPYPQPNYFCGIPPWHGYVQTWYDTSSAETIHTMDRELLAAPPSWIVYQRQLDSIGAHEKAFLHTLPHRETDSLIMSKLASGDWTLEQQTCHFGSEWLVIRTAPVPAGTAKRMPRVPDEKAYSCPYRM